MKIRILSAILVLCLVFSCVACGEDQQNNSTEPDGTTAPSTPTIPSEPGGGSNFPSAPEVDPTKVALTVNGFEISAIELNYFYGDAINEYISQYGQWISYILDVSKPLSQQYLSSDSDVTWGEHFRDAAIDSAKNTYALYSAAQAAGHKLSESEEEAINKLYDNINSYIKSYGYKSVDDYLVDSYGSGADFASYQKYYKVILTVSSYYSAYANQLKDSYTDAVLREFEGKEAYKYNSYTYYTYFLEAKDFESEDALTEAAKKLSDPAINTSEKFNAAIEELEKDMDSEQSTGEGDDKQYSTATEYRDKIYSGINATLQEWLRDSVRAAGDIGAFPNYISDNSENKTLNGYYIVLFESVNDNTFALANVRHILVTFEGGTYDKTTGQTTYSEAEKTKAKNEALLIYNEWLNGDKTEDSFAELAKKYTDDGNGDVGGIYEDIYPGQMVQTFNDWCFDSSRVHGDHGLVETEFGYHIMFYSADSETSYRDFMASNDKLQLDMEAWQKALLDAAKLETIDTSAVNIHYVIYAG